MHLLERVRAARPELAALRQVDQRRRRALDRVQLLRLGPVEPRDRAEQPPRVRVLRVVEDVPLRAALDDPARVHDEDLVGDLGDDAEVVRDQDHGRVELGAQAVEQLEDLRLDRHVERRRRLVGDQDVRVARERHRDHRPLAHAARELVRVVVDARLRRSGSRPARSSSTARRLAPRLLDDARACGSPRRSGRRPCRPGSATSSGPGRSSRSRRPRTSRSCDSGSVEQVLALVVDLALEAGVLVAREPEERHAR